MSEEKALKEFPTEKEFINDIKNFSIEDEKKAIEKFDKIWTNEISSEKLVLKNINKIKNEDISGYERFKSYMLLEFFYFSNGGDCWMKRDILNAWKNSKICGGNLVEKFFISQDHLLNKVNNFINQGKRLEISQEILDKLILTDIKINFCNMPFNTIYFDLHGLSYENFNFFGFLVRLRSPINKEWNENLLKEKEGVLEFIACGLDNSDGECFYNCGYIYNENLKFKEFPIKKDLSPHKGYEFSFLNEEEDKKMKKFISKLICNLLSLINHPEVEIKNISKKNMRINKNKKGLLGVPDKLEINLTGKLRKFFYENMEKNSQNYKLNNKFWVRGHWVKFISERYKNMQGKKIWILPYLKGNGEIKNKNYYVGKKEGCWKQEKLMIQMIQNLYPEYKLEKNNRTALNGLEIDCFIKKLNLGFEYNGEQHYNHIKIFHKTMEDFNSQKQRDIKKNKIAKEKGIKLITIKYDELLSEELIINKIKEFSI
jgi:hypothetical protein